MPASIKRMAVKQAKKLDMSLSQYIRYLIRTDAGENKK